MTILDEIFAHKRVEVAECQRYAPLTEVRAAAEAKPPARNFVAALQGSAFAPALIAEVKCASPSRGVLVTDFQPLSLAQAYAENGASAISVLTDRRYFHGSLDILRQIAALNLPTPLLRKDFLFDPYQVYEARAAGADAVLLIAAMLPAAQLADLCALTVELGMSALLEVHNQAERKAIAFLHPPLVGINNRDLHTFRVDLQTSLDLRPLLPAHTCVVAESGIHHEADVARLREAGINAMLIGEALVLAADLPATIRSLTGVLCR